MGGVEAGDEDIDDREPVDDTEADDNDNEDDAAGDVDGDEEKNWCLLLDDPLVLVTMGSDDACSIAEDIQILSY